MPERNEKNYLTLMKIGAQGFVGSNLTVEFRNGDKLINQKKNINERNGQK